ncbi:MAG: N-acetyltransferase family protein [Cyclobacteriaceae bacterium]
MIIRKASIQDLPFIVEIYNQSIKKGQITADMDVFTVEQKLEWFESHTRSNYPVFVCTIDDEIAGYAYLSPYRPGRRALEKTAEITYYVHENYFRNNIGSELINHLIDYAESLNLENIIAVLISSNTPSIKILEKFGFELWGSMPKIVKFNDGSFDHLYYGLKLGSNNNP